MSNLKYLPPRVSAQQNQQAVREGRSQPTEREQREATDRAQEQREAAANLQQFGPIATRQRLIQQGLIPQPAREE